MAQTRAVARTEPISADEADGADEADRGAALWRWLPLTAFALTLGGFGVSMYLTVEHYTGGIVSCPAGGGVIDCQKVTTSAQSKVFGIPVALLGLLFFAALVVVNLPPLWRVASRRLAQLRVAMVAGGMAFVIYLLSAELFVIKAICLWCTAVHVVTFLLFIIVVTSYAATSDRGLEWDGGDDNAAEPT